MSACRLSQLNVRWNLMLTYARVHAYSEPARELDNNNLDCEFDEPKKREILNNYRGKRALPMLRVHNVFGCLPLRNG